MQMMKKVVQVAMLASMTVACSTGATAGDVAAGKAKAAMCAACHGASGVSISPMWPNLAGQQEAYLAKQLRDFKSGQRKDPVMGGLAKPLSDEDIANLAAYYASLK